MIGIEDFAKVEIKVGQILEAVDVPGSDKLLREVVDFGDEKRVVFSGLRKWYTHEDLTGKKFLFATNLEPRKMPSFVETPDGQKTQEYSQGMILAVDGVDGRPVLVEMPESTPLGAKVR
jgi:methionine--tRNA ligase beta chain